MLSIAIIASVNSGTYDHDGYFYSHEITCKSVDPKCVIVKTTITLHSDNKTISTDTNVMFVDDFINWLKSTVWCPGCIGASIPSYADNVKFNLLLITIGYRGVHWWLPHSTHF